MVIAAVGYGLIPLPRAIVREKFRRYNITIKWG
jgi:hypothetical protein